MTKISHRSLSNGAVLTLIDSEVEGPWILVLAGQHGHLGHPTLGAVWLHQMLPTIRSGKVVVCPLLNIPGFQLGCLNYPEFNDTRETIRTTLTKDSPKGSVLDLARSWQPFRGLTKDLWWNVTNLLGGCPTGALDLSASDVRTNTYTLASTVMLEGVEFETADQADLDAAEFWGIGDRHSVQADMRHVASHPTNSWIDPCSVPGGWRVTYEAAPRGSFVAAMHEHGVHALGLDFHYDAQPRQIAVHVHSLISKLLDRPRSYA